jgi:hypothetical protein
MKKSTQTSEHVELDAEGCNLLSTNEHCVTRFDTISTMSIGLKEKEQGSVMSQSTRSEDPGQETHY